MRNTLKYTVDQLRRNRNKNKPSYIDVTNAKANNKEMKPFMNSAQLLTEMKQKIHFSSDEEILVEDFFENTNYYRFSIYNKLLPVNEEKKFSFTDALNLYEFDDFLKKGLYNFTSFLENKWKGSFIYHLGTVYKSDEFYVAQCYLDLSLYNDEDWGHKIIANMQDTIEKSNALSIKHHQKNRAGYVPIWVLIEELTLGQFETFFTQTRSDIRRTYVKENYNHLYFKKINGWISVIRELRNKISHHSRLYGANFTKSPSFLNDDKKMYFADYSNKEMDIKKNQLVASFYIITKFLQFEKSPIKNEWNSFLDEVLRRINSIEKILDVEKYIGFRVADIPLYKIPIT